MKDLNIPFCNIPDIPGKCLQNPYNLFYCELFFFLPVFFYIDPLIDRWCKLLWAGRMNTYLS